MFRVTRINSTNNNIIHAQRFGHRFVLSLLLLIRLLTFRLLIREGQARDDGSTPPRSATLISGTYKADRP